MKIVDVPQSGKLGLTVTYPGRTGLIRRTKVTPKNPNTLDQQLVRQRLRSTAQAYDALTEAQQDAWISAAAALKTKPRLGQSGALTGLQFYTKVNCALLAIGAPTVDVPPALTNIGILPIDALQITNANGQITLKLHTTGAPPDNTMLWGCAWANSGVRRAVSPRLLGKLDSPQNGYCDITPDYVQKFGVPPVGARVFVQVNGSAGGLQGQRLTFSALVPAGA
ncbi:MAG TPA: hypothetical protein VMU04_02925 [Candidatus Acidoferrum sp.]|nr:hypothetical protein [Candidatus Acidoferrum sp.]